MRNEELRDKWTSAIREAEGYDFAPNENTKICSLHFEPSAYSISTTVRRLLPNKIPTIFFSQPEKADEYTLTKIEEIQMDNQYDNDIDPAFIDFEIETLGSEQVNFESNHVSDVFFDIDDLVPIKVDRSTQTDFKKKTENSEFSIKCKRFNRIIKRQKQKIENLEAKIIDLVKKSESDSNSLSPLITKSLAVLVQSAEKNDVKAISILEQIMAYANEKKDSQKEAESKQNVPKKKVTNPSSNVNSDVN